MKNYDFHRQKPIDNYIVDFFCYELRLIIEIDGDSHAQKQEEDSYRQKRLEDLRLTVLRFDDLEVKKHIGNVLRTIEYWIEDFEQNSK
ncbi:endonuclease domain-containing protein [Rhodocytophaga rosea]|uniref:endonuclease domain-containing protein n=1 Tax=Rhodocytophaga rosea TaxID=2704465 RepID=UPI001E5E9963|nr:DUF559 domain-containing protein [Rhodocytophaga rosea]